MKKIRVVCMGDSITEGFGLGDNSEVYYPSVLNTLLGEEYEVFNKGVSGSCVTNTFDKEGNTIGFPYPRQDRYLEALELKGDIYILMTGTNDAQDGSYDDVEGFDPCSNIISYEKEFMHYYQCILEDILTANPEAKVFIVKPVPVLKCIWRKHQQKYLDILLPYYDEIQKRNPGMQLINVYQAFRDYQVKPLESLYQEDGLHPNAEGASLIANTIFNGITK